MKKMIKKYSDYNLWANNRIVQCTESLSIEQMHQPIISSFETVYKTILHIWSAEYIWLERLQGNEVHELPKKMLENEKFFNNRFLSNSANFCDFISAQPDEYFENNTTYRNSKGITYTSQNSTLILHCFNHSSYHRGQLVVLFRQLGLTQIPSTDFIAYDRML
ncbi:MAG: hypothetical protein IT238_10140 [Bacteroidia bacterium]|nr:hypothetical protein [Bacteroidia bacterium]MCZ2247947.1 hypothetical protein [Bacteroidia bacterium]